MHKVRPRTSLRSGWWFGFAKSVKHEDYCMKTIMKYKIGFVRLEF